MKRLFQFFIPIALFVLGHEGLSQEFSKGTFRLGLEAGLNVAGDEFTHKFSDYTFHPSGGLAFEYLLTNEIGLEITFRAAEFKKDLSDIYIDRNNFIIDRFQYTSRYVAGLVGSYYAIGTFAGFTPIVGLRGGMMLYRTSSSSIFGTRPGSWETTIAYGFITSIDYSLTKSLSLRVDYCPLLTTSDNLDGLIQGNSNDGLSIFSLGFFWNINDRPREPEMLELAAIPSPGRVPGNKPESGPADHVTVGSADEHIDRDRSTDPVSSATEESRHSDDPAVPGSKTILSSNPQARTAESSSPGNTEHNSPSATVGSQPPSTEPSDCIATVLRVSDFASLMDLRVNPQNLNLLVEKGNNAVRTFTALFELKSSGTVIASSRKQITLADASKWYDANQFIDFNRLDTQLNLTDPLPMGEYSLAVSLGLDRPVRPVDNEIKLQHIDIESIFGKEAANVRYFISTGKATGSMDNPREIQLNVFGSQFNSSDGPRVSSCDTPEQQAAIRAAYNQPKNAVAASRPEDEEGNRSASPANTSSDTESTLVTPTTHEAVDTPPTAGSHSEATKPASLSSSSKKGSQEPQTPLVIIREPASAVPTDVPEAERKNYLSNTVRGSVSKALSMNSWIKNTKTVSEKVSIVLAEVYFAFDAAELTEESKQVLDYLSRDLVRHPEFVLEIRGFADELGDAAYNQMLSQRRSERVLEYLGRRQVSETRIRARGMGSRTNSQMSHPTQQQFNRKAQIVLLTNK